MLVVEHKKRWLSAIFLLFVITRMAAVKEPCLTLVLPESKSPL
jgi:hypothetical protein